MRKLQIIFLLFFVAQFGNALSQHWNDGIPYFTNIDSVQNVSVDSIISLTPLFGTASQSDDFQFILTGDDWSWPESIEIISAEDIDSRKFLGSDLYLVTDGAGRRIVEVDPVIPLEVWEFSGPLGSDQYLGYPTDAVSYNEMEFGEPVRKILITDQGRHRVIKVIQQNKSIQFQYGDEFEGIGKNQLSSPSDAIPLPDSGRIFINDKGNNRVILIQEADTSIVWELSSRVNPPVGLITQVDLNTPTDIEYNATTQEILITDQGNHRVLKFNKYASAPNWEFGVKGKPDSLDRGLNLPIDADFLPNGNILICDRGNNRIIEVNENKEIVWQFGRRIKNLKDADRLSNNKHLIVAGNLPQRLGYTTTDFVSEMLDVGRLVNFDNLFWEADNIPGISSIKLQLRTAENNLSDLEVAPWSGPTATDSFYISSNTPINSVHDGHRFYQFKGRLITNNPLYTPVLKNVRLSYKYYDTSKTGRIVSEVIADSTDYIVTQWQTLKFNTILPKNLAARNQVELKISLIDANTNAAIRGFTASTVDSTNIQALSNIEELRQKQSLRLQATFKTNNSSVTPRLDWISIDWDRTYSTTSAIDFVNEASFDPVSHYRFSDRIQPGQKFINRIQVILNDPNLEQIQDVISLEIFALSSYDHEEVNLIRQTTGGFMLQPSVPGIILGAGVPAANNGFLEVFDRDTLTIRYTDPTNQADVSTDSVLIIQDTEGIVELIDSAGVAVDTIFLKTIADVFPAQIRIRNENDRNLSPAQDSIVVKIKNATPLDEENEMLIEMANSSGVFNTGEFISTHVIPVILRTTSTVGDTVLQTTGGSQIEIEYDDSFSQNTVVYVRSVVDVSDSLSRFNQNAGSIDFDMAPNPFYGDRHETANLRAVSSIGALQIMKIEVFCLTGEKVSEIDGSQLDFYYNIHPSPKNEYSYTNNWWDLKNLNGDPVSSGTYFVKVSGKILETNVNVSKIKKIVVIR